MFFFSRYRNGAKIEKAIDPSSCSWNRDYHRLGVTKQSVYREVYHSSKLRCSLYTITALDFLRHSSLQKISTETYNYVRGLIGNNAIVCDWRESLEALRQPYRNKCYCVLAARILGHFSIREMEHLEIMM